MLDSPPEVPIAQPLRELLGPGPGVALYRVKLKDPHSILAHPSRGGAAKPGASKGEVPDEVVRLPKVSRGALCPNREFTGWRTQTSKASTLSGSTTRARCLSCFILDSPR